MLSIDILNPNFLGLRLGLGAKLVRREGGHSPPPAPPPPKKKKKNQKSYYVFLLNISNIYLVEIGVGPHKYFSLVVFLKETKLYFIL